MHFRSLVSLTLLLALVAPSVAAQTADPNAANAEWIEGTLVIEQPDFTTLEIVGTITIRKYAIEGTNYDTADDIGNAYQQLVQADEFARNNGQESTRADKFVADMEKGVADSVRTTLSSNFPGANITVNQPFLDRDTLTSPEGDPYRPGVTVYLTARVVRSLADLGFSGYTLDAVGAIFDAGAVVSSDLTLTANAGHDMTYVIAPPASPAGLAFGEPAAGQGATLDAGKLIVRVDNSARTGLATTAVSLTLWNPDRKDASPTTENILTGVTISLGAITEGAEAIPITTTVNVQLDNVDLSKRFANALPSNVELAYMPGDTIRELYLAGAISKATLDNAGDAIVDTVRENLEQSLPGDITVEGGFVPSTLAEGSTDLVTISTVADAEYALEGEAAGNLDLAFDIGAAISLDIDLFSTTDGDSTFTIEAPPGIGILTANGGAISADKRSVTFTVLAGADASKATLKLQKLNTPEYTAQVANLGVIVDLKDLDIEIGKAINGDMGDLIIDVTVVGNLAVIQVPEDMKSSFDSRVSIDYLTSDGMRMLYARGMLTEDDLVELEKTLVEEMGKGLSGALGQNVDVTGGLDRATLAAALISDPPSSDKPIVFRASASLKQSLGGGGGGSGAIALYTQTQSFDLPKVQGLDTIYTIILPKGLAVQNVQMEGGKSETGKSADGRDQFTVTPESDSAKATVSMAVTPTFVVVKFLPIVILAVVIVLLIIGTPIAIVVAKRKKGKA